MQEIKSKVIKEGKMTDIKNKIVIYTQDTENGEKEKVELYNFDFVDHYLEPFSHKSYLRVCCGGKFYYFLTVKSVISSVKVY